MSGVTGIHQDPSLTLSQYIWAIVCWGISEVLNQPATNVVFRLHLSHPLDL